MWVDGKDTWRHERINPSAEGVRDLGLEMVDVYCGCLCAEVIPIALGKVAVIMLFG